jgi:CHAD domain-containing protein
MSYQIKPDEPFPEAIRRIILAELDQARTYLTGRPPDLSPDEAIHEARKCFKKLRAALRLVRNDIGETSFNRENKAIRDAGRLLSDLRDSYVLVETVDSLQQTYADQLHPAALANVRWQLLARYERISAEMLGSPERVDQVVAVLDEARPRLAALPISSDGPAVWRGGLRRVYRRGRRRMALAYKQPTSEHFHDWRKRVKYFWYHLLILQPLWETAVPHWADDVHLLSDYLGLEHDLAVLREVVLHESIKTNEAERHLLLALIAQERDRLQTKAQPLGERLYADTPAELVEQMVAYWQAWQ